MKSIIFSISILLLSGCTAALYEDEASLNNLVNASPILDDDSTAKLTTRAESIVFFYKSWHALSVPNNLNNWEFHYKIGESSSPNFKVQKITSFNHYQKEINDEAAKKVLQSSAAKVGGDAIINFYREPVIDGRVLPAKVIAYKYKGDIVKRL